MLAAMRNSILAIRRSARILLLQLLGHPLLFLLFIVWLWIPERLAAQLVLTALLGFTIVAGVVILQALTMNYFRQCSLETVSPVRSATRACLRHLPAFLCWLLIVIFVFYKLDEAGDSATAAGAYFRSMWPASLRGSVSQNAVDETASHLIWIAKYYLFPVLFLPLGMQLAGRGFAGASHAWRPLGHLKYWLLMAVLALLGIWLPAHLMDWRPGAGLPMQMISLALRLSAAFLAALFSWMLALALTGDILCAFDTVPPRVPAPIQDAGDHRDGEAAV